MVEFARAGRDGLLVADDPAIALQHVGERTVSAHISVGPTDVAGEVYEFSTGGHVRRRDPGGQSSQQR